ncbi:hypothetical protein FRC10_006177 [Ceratobasidium sp. 414]|nr:hypothetical protein FRC10_006177 [Ceratobasidium sp. 414]
MRFPSFVFGLTFAIQVLAAPILLQRDGSVTPLDTKTISSYSFYANFVAAAYCSGTVDWSCRACKRIPGFVPYATGGNGGKLHKLTRLPQGYVGWWPAGSSVVVAHEGTDPLQFQSLLTDAKFFLSPLSTKLFPGVSNNVLVHSGFRDAHAASAPQILAAVQKIIVEKGATKVTVVGHSLGGAIAALESLYLKLNLPSSVAIKGVTYGQPRVGNPDFANWIDATIDDFSRITNMDDPIPILPGLISSQLKPVLQAVSWDTVMLAAKSTLKRQANGTLAEFHCE